MAVGSCTRDRGLESGIQHVSAGRVLRAQARTLTAADLGKRLDLTRMPSAT